MKWYIRLGFALGMWWKQWEDFTLGYPEHDRECLRCGDRTRMRRQNWKTKQWQYACQGCHKVWIESQRNPTERSEQ